MEYKEWLKQEAKKKRDNPTICENNVIEFLKKYKIRYKFQVPIMIKPKKGYIADFLLFGKVVLEIDGSAHSTEEAKERDRQRTKDLEDKGYTVMRMRNQSTTKKNIDRVLLDRLKKVMPPTADRVEKVMEKNRRRAYYTPKPDWNWKERLWDLSGGHYSNP